MMTKYARCVNADKLEFSSDELQNKLAFVVQSSQGFSCDSPPPPQHDADMMEKFSARAETTLIKNINKTKTKQMVLLSLQMSNLSTVPFQ